MRHDLVLSSFGAAVPEIVEAAVVAERSGFDGVWAFDHFSGTMLGRPWSREPFVVLGAIAASTRRVTLGPLVANIGNRHPAQLASALNSLQSLAPGRVLCGVGSGAAAGTRFAGEIEMIGRPIGDASERRARLVETIECLRSIWAGEGYAGKYVRCTPPNGAGPGVTDGAAAPPIVVGASGEPTVRLAAECADGVNIRDSGDVATLVGAAREAAGERPFEISVFTPFEPEHPLGGDSGRLAMLGVDRRTMFTSAPFDLRAIETIGSRLSAG
jgi:alkanesulfonate monooxygenase SsuD/methylene tetrahydromethanopterin reductase-like flavin-dependent oxidoreductase (luciferase family)